MNPKLRKVLTEIDFKNRFNALYQEHAHRNLFKKTDPLEVEKIINKLGFKCLYFKGDKFFRVDYQDSEVCLNLSVDLGIVDFILDIVIDGEGDGGPFGYLSSKIEREENIKKPRFGTYEELEIILSEGLKIYSDIKNALKIIS